MTHVVSPASLATALALVLAAAGAPALAGTVTGKLDLPPAGELPPPTNPGFLDRTENPLKGPQPAPVAPFLFVELDGTPPAAPTGVTWELVGESFAHPVIAAMAGAEVQIKNVSRTPHTLATTDGKTLPPEVINASGRRTFTVAANQVYTIHDPDEPSFFGRVVATTTPYIGYLDPATGKFEIPDVPDGSYKLRVYFKDGWLDVEQAVTVGKGKTTDVATVKVASLKPAGAPAPAGAGK